MAQRRITARMCIGASEGASGSAALGRAAPPHRPLGSVSLGAASHTCDTLCVIAPIGLLMHNAMLYLINASSGRQLAR
jgi:hypothetical protein